jgi:hypothetical protein
VGEPCARAMLRPRAQHIVSSLLTQVSNLEKLLVQSQAGLPIPPVSIGVMYGI